MSNVPAVDEVVNRTEPVGDEWNPFNDADLVVYTADTDFAEQEPKTENLKELDLVSWSLWARFEDDMVEIPIVGEASWHIWYSLSAETWAPDPADPVSDAFIATVAEMVDEDVGDGWGDIQDETWQATTKLEKYIVNLVREGFLTMEAAEPALIIEWCTARYRDQPGGERNE